MMPWRGHPAVLLCFTHAGQGTLKKHSRFLVRSFIITCPGLLISNGMTYCS
jgi:hypothetical protein